MAPAWAPGGAAGTFVDRRTLKASFPASRGSAAGSDGKFVDGGRSYRDRSSPLCRARLGTEGSWIGGGEESAYVRGSEALVALVTTPCGICVRGRREAARPETFVDRRAGYGEAERVRSWIGGGPALRSTPLASLSGDPGGYAEAFVDRRVESAGVYLPSRSLARLLRGSEVHTVSRRPFVEHEGWFVDLRLGSAQRVATTHRLWTQKHSWSGGPH